VVAAKKKVKGKSEEGENFKIKKRRLGVGGGEIPKGKGGTEKKLPKRKKEGPTMEMKKKEDWLFRIKGKNPSGNKIRNNCHRIVKKRRGVIHSGRGKKGMVTF